MLKLALAIIIVALGGNAMAHETETFTVYVTRHAEKVPDQVDPGLSNKGQQRANNLAIMLKHTKLEKVLSTKYKRTQETAAPVAAQFNLPVTTYAASDSEALAKALLTEQRNALVIGHSNTVPTLVKFLGGDDFELSERDYGDVFMLQFHADELIVTRLVVTVPE
jgi:Phosphohistidine phosphatase SixA